MRALRRLSLATASSCCAVLVIEVLCRTYVYAVPLPAAPSLQELAASPLPPYKHADFYSLDFLRQMEAFKPDFVAPADRSYMLVTDFSSTLFNVRGGLRVTSDQPRDPARRILMFGGSTMFSSDVPDRYTIPSFIQRSANAFCPDRFAVFNYGIPGMNATQQVARLKTVEIHKRDVVVFYDGFNDVLYTVLTGTRGFDPEGPDMAPAIGYVAAWSRRVHVAAEQWREVSAVAEVIARAGEQSIPETLSDRQILAANLSIAREDYRRALTGARELALAAGADFFHFLQPHLFTTPLATSYRRALADDKAALDRALQAGYPVLGEAIDAARTLGVVSVDLSRIFASLPLSDEVFLDEVHVNHKGNEIIASAMFKEMGAALGCRPSGVDQ